MSEDATAKCLGCGKRLPIAQLERFESLGGYEEDGYYCKDCLLVVEESDDSQDWLDELEADEED